MQELAVAMHRNNANSVVTHQRSQAPLMLKYLFVSYYMYFTVEVGSPFFIVGMTLGELRQLYFRLREEVFIGGMLSASKKSDALESLLQQQFGDKRMSEVEFPK